MLRSELVSDVRAVDWGVLQATYGSGEVVRDIILGLVSSDEAVLRRAWELIDETNLQHQGTVYPATAAAAPFLCRIALDESARWRAAVTVSLAFLATGYDEPYSPAGTAQAVRDAVRPYVTELLNLWGTGDQGLDMALVALSAAFPVEAVAAVAQLRDWFVRSEGPVRTVLGLALGFHGSTDDVVRQMVEDEIRQSIRWVVNNDRSITYLPRPKSPRADEEPYIRSRLPEAIHVARRLQAGAEEQDIGFSPVFGFLLTLMSSGAGPLIEWPI